MATNARTLDVEAFMQEVTQKNLDVKGPSGGYLYAGYQGPAGWELIRCANNPWYVYQARRILTSPAGGGVLCIRFQIPNGCVAKIIAIYIRGPASAGSAQNAYILDEDGAATVYAANVTAAANIVVDLPSLGANAATSGNLTNTVGMMMAPGQIFSTTSSVSLQNETLTLGVVLLLSQNSEPTWDTTGSAAGATLAANTISVARTMQLVPMQ